MGGLTWADVFGVPGPATCVVCGKRIVGNAFAFDDGKFYHLHEWPAFHSTPNDPAAVPTEEPRAR